MFKRNIRTGIFFSLLLGCIVLAAITFYGDTPRMAAKLVNFRWIYLPFILILALFNYFLRFVRWHYYLRRIEVKIHWRKSLLIFLSGFSMAITPGKAGEILKSYLLKRSTGAPISHTSPVIVAERLTDAIAMLGFAATGSALYHFGWVLLLLIFIVGLLSILVVHNRSLTLKMFRFAERLPVVSRIAHLLRSFYESFFNLLQWRVLLFAVLISLLSWSGECVAFYFVFIGLGIAPGPFLFIQATFILAVSLLIGATSGLPGGLGAADGSMLGLTRALISNSAPLGGAATLLFRLCTFWFGVGIGAGALLIFKVTQQNEYFDKLMGGKEEQRYDGSIPIWRRTKIISTDFSSFDK